MVTSLHKMVCFVVYIYWYLLWFTKNGIMNVVYKKWYERGLQKVVCTWFTKSGMYVVYKKWYVCGLHKVVCLWFT